MSLFEDKTEAFIVRIWLERSAIPDAPPEWRGVIEHVTSGKRLYVRNLNDIVAFIAHYLRNLGKCASHS